MKKLSLLLCIFAIATSLSACQLSQSLHSASEPQPPAGTPLRMVENVTVAYRPNPSSHRVYHLQNTLNPLMRILRDIKYNKPIQKPEALDQCKSYFSFSVQYASGEHQVYRLLAHQYLKVGNERWYEISREDALALTQFLLDHESDIEFSSESEKPAPVILSDTPTAK